MSCPSTRCPKVLSCAMLRPSTVIDPLSPEPPVPPRMVPSLELDFPPALERPSKVIAELWLVLSLVVKGPVLLLPEELVRSVVLPRPLSLPSPTSEDVIFLFARTTGYLSLTLGLRVCLLFSYRLRFINTYPSHFKK